MTPEKHSPVEQQQPLVLWKEESIRNEGETVFLRTFTDGVVIKVYLYLVLRVIRYRVTLTEIYAECLVNSLHLKLLPIKRAESECMSLSVLCVCMCVYACMVATHLLSIWYLDWDQIEDC